MPLTRRLSVGAYPVLVFDGELSQDALRRLYHDLAFERRYARSEAATAERLHVRHWATEIDAPEFAASDVGRLTAQRVAECFPAEDLHPFRVYCNSNAYGDALSIHRDCTATEPDVTALWFVCEQWERDWRGELLFFDERDDAQAAVTPAPGRLCVFRGALPHAGTPPSRFCFAPRLTLAFKFAPPERPAEAREAGAAAFPDAPSVFDHIARRLAGLPARPTRARYQFVIEGAGGGRWFVEWSAEGGRVVAGEHEADLVIRAATGTLLDVVNRRTNVARAFVLGRVRAKGDLSLAVHLRELLGPAPESAA
jgi:hypothetical protein